jgi:hypothetical protein
LCVGGEGTHLKSVSVMKNLLAVCSNDISTLISAVL